MTENSLVLERQIAGDGSERCFSIRREGSRLFFWEDQEIKLELSDKILLSLLQRYALPLERPATNFSSTLRLTPKAKQEEWFVHGWHYRAPVDVESKYYLVLQSPQGEHSACLGKQASAALRFLSREN